MKTKITPYSKGMLKRLPIILIIGMLFWAGCSTDDDNRVTVCNYDDEEYRIDLHRYADRVVIMSFTLDEWYNLGEQCDEFENVPEDRYYISIHEDGMILSDTSEDFYMDEEDSEYFWIESPGRIHRD